MPIFVKNQSTFDEAIKHIKDTDFNQFSDREDSKGNPMYGLGYDYKPDSDWGKVTPRGLIVVVKRSFNDAIRKALHKKLNWKDDAAA